MAQIVDADAGQFGLCPHVFLDPLDVLKRLAFGLARNTHSQSSRTRSRILPSSAAAEALIGARCSGRDPDGGFEIELIPGRAEHFAAPSAGQQDLPYRIGGMPVRMGVERGGQPPDFIGKR